MRFYGNVAGVIHDTQQPTKAPIDGGRRCRNCHEWFDHRESGMYAYCSKECRDARRKMMRNTKWRAGA